MKTTGKLTGEEIIEILKNNLDDPYEFEELTYGSNSAKLNLGKCEMVEDESLTSGEAWRVLYFEDHEVYIQQTGYYDSYESYAVYDEHDYMEVQPYTKVVTCFEAKK